MGGKQQKSDGDASPAAAPTAAWEAAPSLLSVAEAQRTSVRRLLRARPRPLRGLTERSTTPRYFFALEEDARSTPRPLRQPTRILYHQK